MFKNYVTINKDILNPTAKNFAVAEEYVVIERNGKRFLLLKMTNGSDGKIDGIIVSIKQYDADGKFLSEKTVSQKGYNVQPKDRFGLKDGIALDGNCETVDAEIVGTVCGKIKREYANGEVTTSFISDKKRLTLEEICEKADGKRYKAKSNFGSSPWKAISVCILAVIFSVSMFTFYLFVFKKNAVDFTVDGCNYVFTDYAKTKVSLVGYKGRARTVEIPSEVGEYKVESIGNGAFSNTSAVKTIKINGSPKIENYAFAYANGLVEIDFGDCEEIGDYALFSSGSLEKVVAKSATKIGERAFEECIALKTIELPSLSAVTLGEYAFYNTGLESFSAYELKFDGRMYTVFGGCASLKSFSVGKWDETLYIRSLFDDMNVVEKITIDRLKNIPSYFCEGMTSLKEFTVKNLEKGEVGNNAFSGCAVLEKFDVSRKIQSLGDRAFERTKLASFDGSFVTATGEKVFAGNTALKSYVFNGKVAAVPSGMFSGCVSLESVSVPNSCVEIQTEAFANCASLKLIDLPSSLEKIGYNAFSGCASLEDVDIPATVYSIGDYAFSSCAALTKIIVPDSVTYIGAYAFSGCENLEEITVPFVGTDKNGYGMRKFSDVFGNVPKSLKKVTVRGGNIPSEAFYGCKYIQNIKLPSGLATIGSQAFYGCYSLEEITFPETLTDLGYDAFGECYRLYVVYDYSRISSYDFSLGGAKNYALAILGKSEKAERSETDGYRFLAVRGKAYLVGYNGTSKNLVVPTNPVVGGKTYDKYSIPQYAFFSPDGDSDIESVDMESGATEIGKNAFFGAKSLKTVKIPESVETVGEYAFAECSALESISLPARLKTLGSNAFENDVGLKTAYIGEKLTEISAYTFFGCEALETVNVPSSVGNIGNNAFYGCAELQRITLPSNLTYIDYYAFYGCDTLYEIYNLSKLRISKGSEDNGYVARNAYIIHTSADEEQMTRVSDKDKGIIFIRPNGKWIMVKNGFSEGKLELKTFKTGGYTISDYALADGLFAGRYAVTSVAIGKEVNDIGAGTFETCGGLSEVKFDSDSPITVIREYAFYGCSNLKNIVIPNKVTKIGVGAFSECGGMYTVTLPASLKNIETNAFANCTKLVEIFDLTQGLGIKAKSASNGKVAYNALVIHKSLSEQAAKFANVNGYEFISLSDGWKLFYNGSYDSFCNLPQNILDGGTVLSSEYTVLKSAMNSDITRIVIPTAVKGFEGGAIAVCDNLYRVYYQGTNWASFSKANSFPSVEVYTYVDCVHDEKTWTYDSRGDVDDYVKTFYYYESTAATCISKGKTVYKCQNCGATRTEIGKKYGSHNVGADGKCTVCGATRTALDVTGNISGVLTVGNADGSNYAKGSDGKYTVTASDGKEQTLVVTALTDCELNLAAEFGGTRAANVSVIINGTTETSFYGDGETTISLSKGDKVEIKLSLSYPYYEVKFGVKLKVYTYKGGKSKVD